MTRTFVLIVLCLCYTVSAYAQRVQIERNIARSKATLSAALSDPSWKDGETIRTHGYSSQGDDGGGEYIFHSSGWSSLTATQQGQTGWFVRIGATDKYLEAIDKSVVDWLKFGGSLSDLGSQFSAIASIAEETNKALVLPAGSLTLTTPVTHEITDRLVIQSKGKTSIAINGGSPTGLAFRAPTRLTTSLAAEVSFGDRSVTLSDATGVTVGDVIFFNTSTPVDVTYGYAKVMSMKVSGVSGSVVQLSEPANFNFTTGETTITVFEPAQLEISDTTFVNASGKRTDFQYLSHSTLTDCKISAANISTDGWFIYGCHNVLIVRPQCTLSRYSIVVSGGTRNTTITDLFANGVRHPVDPQIWAYNTKIYRAHAVNTQTLINCHPSFETWYIDCKDHAQASQPAYALRCLGGGLIDCEFNEQGSSVTNPSAGAIMRPDYEWLQDEYDRYYTRCKSQTTFLSAAYARNVFIEDCSFPYFSMDGISSEISGGVFWRGENTATDARPNRIGRLNQYSDKYLPRISPVDDYAVSGRVFNISGITQANPAVVTLDRSNLSGTSDAGTDRIGYVAHGLSNGTQVEFFTNVPDPLTTGTLYFVVNATADNFQVSATEGGAAIDLTDTNLAVGFLDVPSVDTVFIDGGAGMTQINQEFYTINSATSKTLTLDLDASAYSAYTSGGKASESQAVTAIDRRLFIGTGSFPFRLAATLRANNGTTGTTTLTIPTKVALVGLQEPQYRSLKLKIQAHSKQRGHAQTEYIIRYFTGSTSFSAIGAAANTVSSGTITVQANNLRHNFFTQVTAQGGNAGSDYDEYYLTFDVVVGVSAAADAVNRVEIEIEEYANGS